MTNQKSNRTGELFSVKYSKMLSFSQVAEALMGLIYHRPLAKISFQHTLPDDGRSISRNVAEKHYDSRHDKLRNNMDTTESTNTNIFKIYFLVSKILSLMCFWKWEMGKGTHQLNLGVRCSV